MMVNFQAETNQIRLHNIMFPPPSSWNEFLCWHAAFCPFQTYGSVQNTQPLSYQSLDDCPSSAVEYSGGLQQM